MSKTRGGGAGGTSSMAVSKRTPLSVLRESISKTFSLKRKKSQKSSAGQSSRAKRYGSPTDQYRYCTASSNLYYECEDRLCNKYYLHDASGDKVSKRPKFCTIITLSEAEIEPRTEYLQTGRPPMDRTCETIQLLILGENESIHRARNEAAFMGRSQLEYADIRSIEDVLSLLALTHHAPAFFREGVDLYTAYFLRDEDLEELGLKTGERIRLQIALDYMRKITVPVVQSQVMRTTKFIKGDIVEHLKESENLIRRGKIVGVHADDLASGVYYTVALDKENGYELQSAERKLEFPGIWEETLRAQGIEPIFTEPGGEEEQQQQQYVAPPPLPSTTTSKSNEFEKYAKMKRAGIPEPAIRNAMERDGVAHAIPPGFFDAPAASAPPPQRERSRDEEELLSFIVDEEPEQQMEHVRRMSSGIATSSSPPRPVSRSTAAPSVSELEILKAIDEQLSFEASQKENGSFPPRTTTLRRMSSSVTGLPPPPPVPSDYFSDMRLASLEPEIEEEEMELSGMPPPPPVPPPSRVVQSGLNAPPPPTATTNQWEEDISYLNNSSIAPTNMYEEPFEFEEDDYTVHL